MREGAKQPERTPIFMPCFKAICRDKETYWDHYYANEYLVHVSSFMVWGGLLEAVRSFLFEAVEPVIGSGAHKNHHCLYICA
jgi:hypothetical protein